MGIHVVVPYGPKTYKEAMRKAEKDILCSALQRCDGSATRAAKELELSIRTLYDRISKLEIDLRDCVPATPPDEPIA